MVRMHQISPPLCRWHSAEAEFSLSSNPEQRRAGRGGAGRCKRPQKYLHFPDFIYVGNLKFDIKFQQQKCLHYSVFQTGTVQLLRWTVAFISYLWLIIMIITTYLAYVMLQLLQAPKLIVKPQSFLFKFQTQSFLFYQLLPECHMSLEEVLLHPTDISTLNPCMYVDIVDSVYEKWCIIFYMTSSRRIFTIKIPSKKW